MKKLELCINGLVIDKGARLIIRKLEETPGVRNVCVDTAARTTIVEHDERKCSTEKLLKAITSAGYQVDNYLEEKADEQFVRS
jgi:copper chaperone CopZ